MKTAIICLCLLGVVLAGTLRMEDLQFARFMKKYNKMYASNEEFAYRLNVFKTNLKLAAEFQAKEKTNGATFGITKFMDLTPEEFARFYKMPSRNFARDYKATAPIKSEFSAEKIQSQGFSPDPTNWDWFTQGVCTPVYNQGQCGSCWAFSATETIESYYALAGNQLTQLSMEQIVDCDVNGPDGCCDQCNGGWPYAAYDYVQQNGGIDSYESYPYTAESGNAGTCQYSTQSEVTSVSGYQQISGESGLYSQLSTGGPVSVCVDASSWQYYTGGVLTSCTDNVDHCVQATGYANYNQDNSYWIVRNSWGGDWGESGFIWIETGQDLCAIGDYATIANI